MRDVGESLTVAPATELLLGSKFKASDTALEIYDLSKDCRRPSLLSRLTLPGLPLHAGQFTADGKTFYGAVGSGDREIFATGLIAVDTTQPKLPQLIANWIPEQKDWATHALAVSQETNRAYVALLRSKDDSDRSAFVNGLVILDITDVQARRTEPKFRVISTLFWEDTHYAQFPLLVSVQNRPYLIFTDLMGSMGLAKPPTTNACDSGKPGHGFARIIDLGDEKNPRTVSALMLEVHDPANCADTRLDQAALFGYGSLACDVDNPNRARLLACGYFEGGLRVFDIRNPYQPREVAYYKPPARRAEFRAASVLRPKESAAIDHTADQVVVPKFRNDAREIAFISFDNGFQIVSFTEHFRRLHPELFSM